MLLSAVAGAAFAETTPRTSAGEYPVRATAQGATFAAEYFGRSAPGAKDGCFTGCMVLDGGKPIGTVVVGLQVARLK